MAYDPFVRGPLFVRGLALAHMDAVLKGNGEAERMLADGLAGTLAARGVEIQ